MPSPRKKLHVAATCCAAAAVAFLLDSCSSSPKIKGIPRNLPNISLAGNTATPKHNMSQYDYPFDARGRYKTDWAANGERKSGRSAEATSSDMDNWSDSYGGSATGKTREEERKSPVRKVEAVPVSEPPPRMVASAEPPKPKLTERKRSSGRTTTTVTPPPLPAPEPVVADAGEPKPKPKPKSTSESTTAKPKPKPKPESTVATAKPKPKPKPKAKPASVYTVKSGDTLGAIAMRNSTTVAKIKAANGMSSDFLSIGKKLKMP